MITEAFNSIEYRGTATADLIRNYKEYIDRVSKLFRLGIYHVEDGDRPDLVAYKLYGNHNLYWLILYLNGIYDPFHDWVKESGALYQSTKQKYEDMGGVNQIAYFRSNEGEIFYDLVQSPEVPSNWYHKGDKFFRHVQFVGHLHPISINLAEDEKNDQKRTIRVVEPNDLRSFMEALNREVSKAKGYKNA